MAMPPLRDRHSGYNGTPADWEAFLACWRNDVVRYGLPIDGQIISVLSKYWFLANEPQPSLEEVEAGIQRLEARLHLQLPPSYKDFVRAYRPPRYRPHDVVGGTGFFDLDRVDTLKRVDPVVARIAVEIPIEADDAQYYQYGIEQNDVAVRTLNRPDAIVVGSHGDAIYNLILLYPQDRTQDGEMQASLPFHSGEFRAPSFAELMRQLAYMETRNPPHVPPYGQQLIANSCAGRLPLENVWWK